MYVQYALKRCVTLSGRLQSSRWVQGFYAQNLLGAKVVGCVLLVPAEGAARNERVSRMEPGYSLRHLAGRPSSVSGGGRNRRKPLR